MFSPQKCANIVGKLLQCKYIIYKNIGKVLVGRVPSYTSSQLKGMRKGVKRPWLPQTTFNRIKELGILKPFRGGIKNNKRNRAVHQINTIVNNRKCLNINNNKVNHSSLIQVRTDNDMNKEGVKTGHNKVRGVNNSNLIRIKFIKEENIKNIQVHYLNARSVCSKAEQIAEFIADNDADVCLITETWLRNGDQDNLTIQQLTPTGYSIHHAPRLTRRGGGVAVLFKDTLNLTKEQNDCSFNTFELIETKLQTSGEAIRICVVYRPPAGSIVEFMEEFTHFIDGHTTTTGRLLIVGDFNIHYEATRDSQVRAFRSLLDAMNLHQLVQEPTHEKGHTLDLLLTREDEADMVSNLGVSPLVMSDHYTLAFLLPWKKTGFSKTSIKSRNTKNIDMDKLKDDIENSELVKNPPSDLDELVTCYHDTLSTIFNLHAPVTEKGVVLRPNTPWYNEHIRQAKQKRRQAERKFRKTKSEIDKEILKENQKLVNDLSTKAKQTYYNSKITDAENNSKTLFQISKQLLCKSNRNILPSHSSNTELANKFSHYFNDKIAKIRLDLENNVGNNKDDSIGTTQTQTQTQTQTHTSNTQTLKSFTNITEEKLFKIIQSGNSKSCSLDPMPTSFVKGLLPVLLPTILTIVNKSLSESHMPTALKDAIVKPLIKKPSLDKDNLKNYRPVSNLAYLGKLIESVAIEQIDDHLSAFGLHEPLQSAYTPHHSTETAVIKVTNDILCALDHKQCVYLVLLDLSAAFDTIDHNVFLSRLQEDYGVIGDVTDWMASYLFDRHQTVDINNTLSDKISLQYGFPQGSKIGPFGFKLYTKQLSAIANKHDIQIHLYADDTQLYTSFDPSIAIQNCEGYWGDVRSNSHHEVACQ